ncbi:MAG: hypothetical protein HY271_00960 [Deltaproteobacteria bacterium]|nr:hypothetical protein [Deltaproteobacteria bacterium]
MSKTMTRITLILSAGAFAAVVGIPAVHAEDTTVIEKRTEESHSYKVEPAAPAIVERRTTVKTVPAQPASSPNTRRWSAFLLRK